MLSGSQSSSLSRRTRAHYTDSAQRVGAACLSVAAKVAECKVSTKRLAVLVVQAGGSGMPAPPPVGPLSSDHRQPACSADVDGGSTKGMAEEMWQSLSILERRVVNTLEWQFLPALPYDAFKAGVQKHLKRVQTGEASAPLEPWLAVGYGFLDQR